MEYGWVMLFILSIMGGIIAYLGDKIGSRVGKRKIVLFGLRPKYTSIVITILTGISIAVVTLGVMSVLSSRIGSTTGYAAQAGRSIGKRIGR